MRIIYCVFLCNTFNKNTLTIIRKISWKMQFPVQDKASVLWEQFYKMISQCDVCLHMWTFRIFSKLLWHYISALWGEGFQGVFSFKCLHEQQSVEPRTHFLIALNFWWFIKRKDRAASNFASSKVNFTCGGCEPLLHYFNTFHCEHLIPKFIEFRSVVSNKQSPHNKRELTRATPMFKGAQLCNNWFIWVVTSYCPSWRNVTYSYEGWNFNSGNYLFTTDTK